MPAQRTRPSNTPYIADRVVVDEWLLDVARDEVPEPVADAPEHRTRELPAKTSSTARREHRLASMRKGGAR
jgi:hypothetical protein